MAWRGVWVVLAYVRASLSRGVRVVPTLHVESMAACVHVWVEGEEDEAGISKCERVGCRGGAAYVWLERQLAQVQIFSLQLSLASKRWDDPREAVTGMEEACCTQGTKGPLKRQGSRRAERRSVRKSGGHKLSQTSSMGQEEERAMNPSSV